MTYNAEGLGGHLIFSSPLHDLDHTPNLASAQNAHGHHQGMLLCCRPALVQPFCFAVNLVEHVFAIVFCEQLGGAEKFLSFVGGESGARLHVFQLHSTVM